MKEHLKEELEKYLDNKFKSAKVNVEYVKDSDSFIITSKRDTGIYCLEKAVLFTQYHKLQIYATGYNGKIELHIF